MDISRECMCKNDDPECVDCWYSLPGYSVTETKRRLPLRTEPLTYDEEFAAFGHDNDYDGICYEVAPRLQAMVKDVRQQKNWTPPAAALNYFDEPAADAAEKAKAKRFRLDTSSNDMTHADGKPCNCDKDTWCEARATGSNGWDWVNGAETTRQRWNVLKERTTRRAKKADPTFTLDLAARFKECEDLCKAKHSDYGNDSITNAPGGPLNGLRVRIHDKISRINHLIDTGAGPENESLRDSFVDLAVYSVIGLMAIDKAWPGMESS
jgi:hypothetical protein